MEANDMTKTMDYSQRYKKDREAKMWNTSKVIFLLLGMTAVGLVLMFPYVFMINKSLMSTDEILDPNPHFFPIWSALQWDNYVKLFTEAHSDFNYGTALLHTLEIILFNVIAIPLSASMIAFSFAKLRWKGRNAVFALMMLTITLPGVVTQIPLYVIYSKIGWLNTLLPFTIPNLFGGGAMYIFLIRQYMMGIPNELTDAAKIDGCGYWRIFWSIILPNCKSILIYIIITVFMSCWGDYYGPLMFMNSSSAPYTLAYVLFKSSTEGDASTSFAAVRMAGGVFMTIVPTLLFTFFQDRLTDGALTSGIKG
jgi:ABC-type glycerol-3-phosphate transport system permease component